MKKPILILLLLLSVHCSDQPIELDYCKMIEEDQSFVNNDQSDLEQYHLDKAKRREIFAKNFDLIMQKTKQDGFPSASLKHLRDTCQHRAVTMTMIHTAQSNPALFFSKQYAKVFKTELDKGNLERSLLEKSSIITAKTMELCVELRPQIMSAMLLWGLDESLFDEAKFVTCD